MRTRQDIYEAAEYYESVGTKWRHQGRSEASVDCVGLIITCGWDAELFDRSWDFRDYPKSSHPIEFLDRFHQFMTRIPVKEDARAGDVLIVSIGPLLTHCGIISVGRHGYPTFIHSHRGRQRVVEDPLSMWWGASKAAFSYPGVQ